MRRARLVPSEFHQHGGLYQVRRSAPGLSGSHIFNNVTQSACVALSAGTLDSQRRRDHQCSQLYADV